jgi:membrane-associated phospholipid phosphatase
MNRFEESITIKIQENTSNTMIDFMRFMSNVLYSKIIMLVVISLFVYGHISIKQFIGILLIGPIVYLMKGFCKRYRPFYNNTNIKLYDTHKLDLYSFPSGHTIFAFLLYFILRDNNLISSIWIVFPILIAYSRVTLGAHYISDTIVGVIVARLVASFFK